jgi:hypothetical protein
MGHHLFTQTEKEGRFTLPARKKIKKLEREHRFSRAAMIRALS